MSETEKRITELVYALIRAHSGLVLSAEREVEVAIKQLADHIDKQSVRPIRNQ